MTEPSLTTDQAAQIGQAIRQIAALLPMYYGAVDALVDACISELDPVSRYAQSSRIHHERRKQLADAVMTLQLAWAGVQGAASVLPPAPGAENKP